MPPPAYHRFQDPLEGGPVESYSWEMEMEPVVAEGAGLLSRVGAAVSPLAFLAGGAATNIFAAQNRLNHVANPGYGADIHIVKPQKGLPAPGRRKTIGKYGIGTTMAYRRRRYSRRSRKRSRRYGRRKRYVRRRRTTLARSMGSGKPAMFHRMKHRLDSWMYLGMGTSAFGGHHTKPYQIVDIEQAFDIKLNNMHDPYSFTNVSAVNTGTSTAFVPIFYNTMKTLYKTYKVNSVLVELTFTNNRPINMDSQSLITGTSTRTHNNQNELPTLRASEPIICGAFPVAASTDLETSATNDDSWAYRPGSKSFLLHSQQSRTLRFKLNPARVIGLTNSFTSEAYYPSAADTAPDEKSNLRVTWCPPVADATAGDSSRAVSVFCRTWWDVTWSHPLNEGGMYVPGAT